MSKRTRAYLALFGTALVWGAAFPIIKPSLNLVTPAQFLFFRYLIAAPLLFPFFIHWLYRFNPSIKLLLKIAALEFFGTFVILIILYEGLKRTSSIEASLIGATGPIFITLGGVLFLKEREEKHEWFGLMLSFLGTLILIFEPLITGRNHTAAFSFSGNLLILGYNLLYTAYILLAKKAYKNIPKIYVSSVSYLTALLSFWVFLKLTHLSTAISLLSLPAVALASGYMAIFGSIVGFTLYIYGQNLIEASEACLSTYLQGIIALPFAYLLLQEVISLPQVIAILFVAAGVFIGLYRRREKAYN